MTGLDKAAAMLAAAERVVVFTGAGISAESGIPTFRDALTVSGRAPTRSPIHLHGSLFEPRCSACGLAAGDLPEPLGEDRRLPPPACRGCGAPVRPGVVWFGEALPTDAFEQAVEAAANADLLLTIGTSGVVYPAAEIPQVTARLGGRVIQINPEPTPLDEVATVNLTGPAAEVLPALVAAAAKA